MTTKSGSRTDVATKGKRINLRIDSVTYEKILQVSHSNKISLSEVVRLAINSTWQTK